MRMTIQARDIMEPEVHTVDADLSLALLEDFLLRHRISGTPVVEHGRLVGVVSRSDIVRTQSLDRALAGIVSEFYRSIAEESGENVASQWAQSQDVSAHLARRKIRDAMTPELIAVRPDASIQEIACVMRDRHIHRVLVTDGDALLGIVTSSTLVQLIADGRVRTA